MLISMALVEEFIVEIEGAGKNRNVSNWGEWRDIKDGQEEMLKRLDFAFERWLSL